ncbi:MAG TPA: hypothetical protein VM165_17545, partial [Planctomycetaceae bacterium]|nr:hypothetical protein [Planctomycetaceae bacterium]
MPWRHLTLTAFHGLIGCGLLLGGGLPVHSDAASDLPAVESRELAPLAALPKWSAKVSTLAFSPD